MLLNSDHGFDCRRSSKERLFVKKNTQSRGTPDPLSNRLLASLVAADYHVLMADAKVVSLKLKERLYRQDDPVDAVFFPIDCMVSVLAGAAENELVETATIGREGAAGASELIQNQIAMGLHIAQLPGAAVRMEAAAFRKHLAELPQFKSVVERHLYALMRQILHGAACNRLHSLDQRAARWLLMTHDRACTDTFPLTQEFLSKMLGVRRATVNVATGVLKKAGIIRYVRGQLTVLDRQGLETASCGCYAATLRAYDY
jgi:CRP-like cAMP-binding protein